MATSNTNFERFKQLLDSRSAKSSSANTINWFKVTDAETHTLRFLPLKHTNNELPVEIFDHHALSFPDGTFKSFACPKRSAQEPCQFCDLANAEYRKHVNTGLQDSPHKEAFKQLVARRHFLLVGYEPKKVDLSAISSKDVKVVRASSQDSQTIIQGLLEKGKDFVAFKDGRDAELVKKQGKGTIKTVAWVFQDPEQAFAGNRAAQKLWDELLEVSPDLTNVVKVPSHEDIMSLYTQYTSAPVLTEHETVDTPSVTGSQAPRKPEPAQTDGGTTDDDIALLRQRLSADED